jgi:hypothetical protein
MISSCGSAITIATSLAYNRELFHEGVPEGYVTGVEPLCDATVESARSE